ncbi:hypothetical protein [Okeania sp. KiyG1]|nr:hypothetical protein [Okeania sp. KiyG1]
MKSEVSRGEWRFARTEVIFVTGRFDPKIFRLKRWGWATQLF